MMTFGPDLSLAGSDPFMGPAVEYAEFHGTITRPHPAVAAESPRGSFFGLTQRDGRKRIRTLDHREKLPLHHCTTSGVVV